MFAVSLLMFATNTVKKPECPTIAVLEVWKARTVIVLKRGHPLALAEPSAV
jgi:NAD/NADP transhydrogenase beta subunit